MQPGIGHARDALRTEIAETQLLRRLVFRNERKEEISLEVASSRVLRVTHPISDHLKENLPDILMQSVSQSTETQILQFIGVLKVFTSEITQLSVEAQVPSQNASMLDVGLSVDHLFQKFDISEQIRQKQTSKNFLEAFLENCASISTAALLMTDDTFVFEYGLSAPLEALKALALAERASNSTNLQLQGGPSPSSQCVIYTGHPQDMQAVLCASQIPNLAFLSFHSDVLEAVLNYWTPQNS